MSKDLRHVEMLAAFEDIDTLLRRCQIEVEEQINELPEDTFKRPFNADFEEGQEGLLKKEILDHAKELVNSADSEKANEAPYGIDYSTLGLSSVALLAQNYLSQLEIGSIKFLEECQKNMKELDATMAIYKKMVAAIEFRLNNSDDMGEMCWLQKIKPHEEKTALSKIVNIDTELQESLEHILGTIFHGQKHAVTMLISTLCRKVLVGDGDPYVEVTPENERAASNLRKIGIISNHPHNPRKVKLITIE